MASTPFNTPLRYPGGKGRLTRHVAELIKLNELYDGSYVEPYAGGAGVAISLLFLEYVRTIHLNDISPTIYHFWKSVTDLPEEFCQLIHDTPITVEEWTHQRYIQDHQENFSPLEIGFSTFFLNRTNRSGIIRGGIIGGKKQTGEWKIDARFNKQTISERIQRIGRYRDRIKIYSLDTAEFIKTQLPRVSQKALIYLDPPYYVKGNRLYEHHYHHEDHAQIAQLVQEEIKQPWIVSYDNHASIREMYAARRQQEFSLHYSANKRFSGSELMVYSDELVIPDDVITSRSTAA